MTQMQDYLEQKTKEVLTFMDTIVPGSKYIPQDIDHKKKFIKLILEAVWLGGESAGLQLAQKILRE